MDVTELPGFSTPTIVFGADVTHPGPGSLAPSVAAVVGSWDLQVGQPTSHARCPLTYASLQASSYQAETRIQSSREEIIQELQPMVTDLLRVFYAKNGNKPPQRIIFYRSAMAHFFLECAS